MVHRTKVLGWHFITPDRRLLHGDNRLVACGKTYSVPSAIVLCVNGLHGSTSVLDALRSRYDYAQRTVCRTISYGDVKHSHNKFVSRHRHVLWIADEDLVVAALRTAAIRTLADPLGAASNELSRFARAMLSGNVERAEDLSYSYASGVEHTMMRDCLSAYSIFVEDVVYYESLCDSNLLRINMEQEILKLAPVNLPAGRCR